VCKLPTFAIFALVLAQTLLISWLILERRRRRKAEEARRHLAALAHLDRRAAASVADLVRMAADHGIDPVGHM
jgi:hypothetical protein